MEKLIRALRCSATGHGGDFRCPEDCPYREIEKRGCAYDIDCNRTLVMLDAADALEKYQRFKWVPVKVRPTTEEDEIDMHEYPWFLDFPLPDDGERILVSRNGYVDVDENQTYDGVSYHLDGCGDWADGCLNAMVQFPDEYEKTLLDCVKENPAPTNRDKFFEVFGDKNYNYDECCRVIKCESLPCHGCDWWNKEYVEPEKGN